MKWTPQNKSLWDEDEGSIRKGRTYANHANSGRATFPRNIGFRSVQPAEIKVTATLQHRARYVSPTAGKLKPNPSGHRYQT